MKKIAAKGHATKHTAAKKHVTAAKKHAKTVKHSPAKAKKTVKHVTAKAKPATHPKVAGLALDGVACCGAEALAVSLRLQGLSVTGADVLALHRLSGADDEHGAPVEATLDAAVRFGLGGLARAVAVQPADQLALPSGQLVRHWSEVDLGEVDDYLSEGLIHGLILGLDLPEAPHAVFATPDGWWSWGELYCPCEFADAVIYGAWLFSWDGRPGRDSNPRPPISGCFATADRGLPHGALSAGPPGRLAASMGAAA